MKQKFFFLIFFSICLTGVSVYAKDYCCYNGDQAPQCSNCQETSCGPNWVFNRDPKVCKCECGGEQSCGENKVWSQKNCACECQEQSCLGNKTFDKSKCECVCQEQSCLGNKTFDKSKCECVCQEQSCEGSKTFDKSKCECVCQEQSCEGNKTFDKSSCKCVCTETSCSGGKTQNKDTCACECPEGQTEVSNGQCCATGNVADGAGGVKTCCNANGGYAQSTPQCCTKMKGKWFQGESGKGRCCGPNESPYDGNGGPVIPSCCKNCCEKDSSGKPTPFAAGVQGGPSTNRVDRNCCEAAGGTYTAAEGNLFTSGVCCKGSKAISHGNKLNKTCCLAAGGSVKKFGETEKCCKCPKTGGC